jgi:hypothetical protein
MKTPRVITVHDDYQRVELGPSNPSARLPFDTSSSICGLPIHNLCIHHGRCGGVSSNLATVEATKFMRLHKSCMRQYIIEHAHQGQVIGS